MYLISFWANLEQYYKEVLIFFRLLKTKFPKLEAVGMLYDLYLP